MTTHEIVKLKDIDMPEDLRLQLQDLIVMIEMCDWSWYIWRFPNDIQKGKVIFKINIETKTRTYKLDFVKSRAIIPKFNVDKIIEIVDCKFLDIENKVWVRIFIEEDFNLCFKRIKETLLEGK